MKFISKNVEETEKFAYDFAKHIKSPQVICLIGNLGAGKLHSQEDLYVSSVLKRV